MCSSGASPVVSLFLFSFLFLSFPFLFLFLDLLVLSSFVRIKALMTSAHVNYNSWTHGRVALKKPGTSFFWGGGGGNCLCYHWTGIAPPGHPPHTWIPFLLWRLGSLNCSRILLDKILYSVRIQTMNQRSQNMSNSGTIPNPQFWRSIVSTPDTLSFFFSFLPGSIHCNRVLINFNDLVVKGELWLTKWSDIDVTAYSDYASVYTRTRISRALCSHAFTKWQPRVYISMSVVPSRCWTLYSWPLSPQIVL